MSKNPGSIPFAVVCLAALASPCLAPAPRVGEVQRLTVITVSMQVGWTEKETKRVTYTPPPGWYVRGHAVQCKAEDRPLVLHGQHGAAGLGFRLGRTRHRVVPRHDRPGGQGPRRRPEGPLQWSRSRC